MALIELYKYKCLEAGGGLTDTCESHGGPHGLYSYTLITNCTE